jgi:hypothetical protein
MVKTEEQRKRHREYMQEWRDRNPERWAEIQRECYARNREGRQRRMREARARESERLRAESNARHRDRMLHDLAYRAKHRQNCRYHRVLDRNRHFRQGIAAAFAVETRAFYDACPVAMEVDHIEPIKGDGFCGLHVPWNLQYLTMPENRRKRNEVV